MTTPLVIDESQPITQEQFDLLTKALITDGHMTISTVPNPDGTFSHTFTFNYPKHLLPQNIDTEKTS